MVNKRIICVKHSQSLSVVPLKVWMAIKEDGEVLCAHCTCMVGLGEACSHEAAVLFAAEANALNVSLVQHLCHVHGYHQLFEV